MMQCASLTGLSWNLDHIILGHVFLDSQYQDRMFAF